MVMGLGNILSEKVEEGENELERAEIARKRKKEQMGKNPFLKYGIGILNFFKL